MRRRVAVFLLAFPWSVLAWPLGAATGYGTRWMAVDLPAVSDPRVGEVFEAPPPPAGPDRLVPYVGSGWTLEDADWAAVTMLEEAPRDGWTAVAWVIRRRMRECDCRAWQVVTAPMQFQPWRQRWKVRRMLARVARPDREAMEAAAIAADVLGGRVRDPVGGADHFHADWTAPDWAPEMVRTGARGGNVFYRRPVSR